jgi:hypothetical protein
VTSPVAGRVAAALLQPAGAPMRRDASREIARQVGRALWRAERRGRALPFAVRQRARWVFAQRRKIAYELIRALRSLGAGVELASSIAEQACLRFPRDGVVIVDDDASDTPRGRGEAPRERRTNPRVKGTSPRQRGASPRQKRAAAALGVPPSDQLTAAAQAQEPTTTTAPRPLEELAPEWHLIKARMLEGMTSAQRAQALRAGRTERERIERSQKSHPPPST